MKNSTLNRGCGRALVFCSSLLCSNMPEALLGFVTVRNTLRISGLNILKLSVKLKRGAPKNSARQCRILPDEYSVLLLFLKHVKFKFYIYIFSAQFAFSGEQNCNFFLVKKKKLSMSNYAAKSGYLKIFFKV